MAFSIGDFYIRPPKSVRVVATLLMIGFLGSLATLAHAPFLFPSIGPTAMFVVHRPEKRENRWISILLGHAAGALAALAMLFLFGLYGAPSATQEGFTWPRVAAAALAMAITTLFEEKTPFYHPPAAATTLIVSLGIMQTPRELAALAVGIIVLAFASILYKRLFLAHRKVQPRAGDVA